MMKLTIFLMFSFFMLLLIDFTGIANPLELDCKFPLSKGSQAIQTPVQDRSFDVLVMLDDAPCCALGMSLTQLGFPRVFG